MFTTGWARRASFFEETEEIWQGRELWVRLRLQEVFKMLPTFGAVGESGLGTSSGRSSAPHLVRVSASLFSGRLASPRTHWNFREILEKTKLANNHTLRRHLVVMLFDPFRGGVGSWIPQRPNSCWAMNHDLDQKSRMWGSWGGGEWYSAVRDHKRCKKNYLSFYLAQIRRQKRLRRQWTHGTVTTNKTGKVSSFV